MERLFGRFALFRLLDRSAKLEPSHRVMEDRQNEQKRIQSSRTCRSDISAGFSDDAVQALPASFTQLLADTFALFIKTKNFHWHVSGPHFRDYHLLLDDQGEQIFAMTDAIAERVRKVGGTTIRSIGHIARCQRVRDNDEACIRPDDMLDELRTDNEFFWQTCARRTRSATRREILPARAFSRIGSTKANRESGFC